jgi:hypothetical protein
LQAVKQNNMIQTVLALTTPFVVAGRSYKDEEEILLYIEALKALINDGFIDGYFQRAMKTYYLTHRGLRRAKEIQSHVPLADRIAQLENKIPAATVKPYEEWSLFKKDLQEQCQQLNLARNSQDFKIGHANHSTAGEVLYKDAVLVHYFEKNTLELHFGMNGTGVGNKRPEKVYHPIHNPDGSVSWCEQANKTISYGSKQLAEWCIERVVTIGNE